MKNGLKIGDQLSYAGFGPGEIIEIVERPVKGESRTFAVLDIPHQGMKAQIPVASNEVMARLRPIVSAKLAARLVKAPKEPVAMRLPASWTERRDRVRALLEGNEPKVWAEIYWAYASFAATGVLLTVADLDNIDRANSLLAAECAYALGRDYLELSSDLRAAWQKSVADQTA